MLLEPPIPQRHHHASTSPKRSNMEFIASSHDEFDYMRYGPFMGSRSSDEIISEKITEHNGMPLRSRSGSGLEGNGNFTKSEGNVLHETMEEKAGSEWIHVAFLFISFGYMSAWTSLGSLISYYKHHYSANFYVKLYCAYYLPGLPVALLQHRYDSYLDMKYGSKNTYMARGVVCQLTMVFILVSMVWVENQGALLCLFALLGVCGWLCHGTASMLASMYPSSAIAYLQTGFRCPEIYTICAVALLNIGSKPTEVHLDTFFIMTAGVVLLGLVIWILVAGSNTSRRYFESKDSRMQSVDEVERQPLINKFALSGGGGGGNMNDNARVSSAEAQYVVAGNTQGGDGDVASSSEVDSHSHSSDDMESRLLDSSSAGIGSGSSGRSSSGFNGVKSSSVGVISGREEKYPTQANGVTSSEVGGQQHIVGSSPSRPRQHISAYTRPMARAKMILRAVEDATMKSGVYYSIWPLCLALVITIWCSIFQASFFAYVDSAQGRDIEQILYFVRLFSDLLGRPFTRIFRPWFLKKNYQLLIASILRVSLMIVFFVYVLVPTFPRSDIFICSIVGVFSALSGYFTVLIYEYAADEGLDGAAQTYATALLNICFQFAAFTAVISSVLFTTFLIDS